MLLGCRQGAQGAQGNALQVARDAGRGCKPRGAKAVCSIAGCAGTGCKRQDATTSRVLQQPCTTQHRRRARGHKRLHACTDSLPRRADHRGGSLAHITPTGRLAARIQPIEQDFMPPPPGWVAGCLVRTGRPEWQSPPSPLVQGARQGHAPPLVQQSLSYLQLLGACLRLLQPP